MRRLSSARCGPTIRAARSAPLRILPCNDGRFFGPTQCWASCLPHDDGRRLRRGHMTPSAGVVRARIASRLALSRRRACSCPSDAAATLICRTVWTPRLGGECWQPGCAMLVLLPALCRRVGWPSFHARARPAERSFRWQHSHPFGWSRVQSSPALRSAWTRPCAREHIADRSPLQPGAMLAAAARLLVQAGGATESIGPCGTAATTARLQRRGGLSRRWRGRPTSEAQLTVRWQGRARGGEPQRCGAVAAVALQRRRGAAAARAAAAGASLNPQAGARRLASGELGAARRVRAKALAL